MKPSFKSDAGYAVAFCTLWLFVLGDTSARWSVPWWLQLGVVWIFVRLCVVADPLRGATGFLTRFVRAGSEVMLRSVALAVLLVGGLLIYWGTTDGFAVAEGRMDKAFLAGLATSDGRIVTVGTAIVLLVVLGGIPLWLRRQSSD